MYIIAIAAEVVTKAIVFKRQVPPGSAQWEYVSTFKSIGATNQSNSSQLKYIFT